MRLLVELVPVPTSLFTFTIFFVFIFFACNLSSNWCARTHSLVPRLEEVTPQLKGDHLQLRLTRKEVNDEINHIYWAGAKMRAHFNRLPKVCARNAPRRPACTCVLERDSPRPALLFYLFISCASLGSNVTPLAPPLLLSTFPLSPQPFAIFGPSCQFSQELQRRMRDGEIRSFEQIYDYIASGKFD